MKVHEFERIVSKLELRVRNARDRLAWFEYEGTVVARTRRSHGSGDLPGHLIRQQLKLTEKQLADLLRCSFGIEDYVSVLKAKGLISN
jgi:hypothetical protein